jgi:ribosome modulation factor
MPSSESQRQQTDLAEVQVERGLQNGIDGRQQGLHRIVQQVAKTHRDEHPK